MIDFTTELLSPREETLEYIRAFARKYSCSRQEEDEQRDIVIG